MKPALNKITHAVKILYISLKFMQIYAEVPWGVASNECGCRQQQFSVFLLGVS